MINRVKKPRRNILLWKKADEDGIKTALIKSQTDIIDNSNDVNKTWHQFLRGFLTLLGVMRVSHSTIS
jgi:hypothetical protein